MKEIIAVAFGLTATALFVFSYQFKTRKTIVLVNGLSRCFYVLQYILLGAWVGAATDLLAAVITAVALSKKLDAAPKTKWLILGTLFAMIIASGVLLYQNIFSLFSIAGVLFELISLLFKKEILVRTLSLIGQPFWLIFNCSCKAWGSVVGNVIAIISIVFALVRYHSGKAVKK